MSGTGNAHPAWEPLLEKIPESLREMVKPVLIEFDTNVQQTLEAKNQELKRYEAFKQFIDNEVDPEWLAEAADFTYNFQENPKAVIENANKVWNLGYNLDGTQQSQQQLDGNEAGSLFEDDPNDITQHPQFAQLMQTVGQMQQNLQEFTSKQDMENQIKEHEQFITKMHETHGDFDDNYVTALMANGSSFPKALEAYQNLAAGFVSNAGDGNGDQQEQQNNDQAGSNDDGAPVVMGGNGNAGNGTPSQPISFGDMKSGDLEDTVLQMLKAANSADS